MDVQGGATTYVVLGLLVVGLAAIGLSPAGDRPMIAETVPDAEPPADATITEYTDLPASAQRVVDETVQSGFATLSVYEDYEAVEVLEGDGYVRKDGEVYHIRTTSADGSGGLFEGIARDTGLAVGGLLLGAAAYVRDRRFRLVLLTFPVAATATVVGANALAAPDPSFVRWNGNAAFGIASGAPVVAGVAVGRRDRSAGALAALTLLASAAVLTLDSDLSALYLFVPLVLFGVPGIAFGRRLAEG